MYGMQILGTSAYGCYGYYVTSVGNELSTQYDILILAGNNTISIYDVYASVNKNVTLYYNILEILGKDIEFEYDITSLYTVTKSLSLRYYISQLAGKNNAIMYDIFTTANKQLTTGYDIFTFIGNSNSFLYDVLETIYNQSSLKYDIRQLIARDIDSRYNINTILNKDFSVLYDIRQKAFKSLNGKYSIIGISYDTFVAGLLKGSNFVVAYDFIDYNITASSEQQGYPADNLKDYYHPRRTWRAVGKTSESVIIDLKETEKVKYVMLNNANFTFVRIEGNDINDWSNPTFFSLRKVTRDERVSRNKSVFELNNFEYRYLKISVYSYGVDGDYVELSNIIIPRKYIEFVTNPDSNYRYGVREAMSQVSFETGGIERITLSPTRRFYSEFGFSYYDKDKEIDHFTLAGLTHSQPVVFIENLPTSAQDGSKSYLAFISKDIEITWTHPRYIRTNDYLVEEII